MIFERLYRNLRPAKNSTGLPSKRYKRGSPTKDIPSTDPDLLIYVQAPPGPPTDPPAQFCLRNGPVSVKFFFFLLPENVGFPHLSSTLMAFSTAFLPRLSPPPLLLPSPTLSFSPSPPPLPTLCTRRAMWSCDQSTDFPRTVVACSSSDLVPPPNSKGLRTQASTIMPFDFTSDEAAMVRPSYKWRRVLLKVSGEALAGDHTENIDPKITMSIAREVASVTRLGIEVAIVVGGGNIFRGSSWAGCSGLDRSSADYIGMLATVMNAIFLQATMESIGIPTRVQTAFRMSEVAEPYIRRRAVRHLEKGRVVIFAAGTGNPFFTTDTAAALRCAEINAEVVLKATNVDGVYEKDPKLYRDAFLHDTLSYNDVTSKDLSVMDMTAITMCQENNIPVVVFNLNKSGNISKAILGERVGTMIGGTWN